eukprot:1052884-Pelagomonas_calceolata.AAC.1
MGCVSWRFEARLRGRAGHIGPYRCGSMGNAVPQCAWPSSRHNLFLLVRGPFLNARSWTWLA